MAKKDTVRLKAEQYYIENMEATQQEVAELYSVRPATIGEWVKKYDWEEKRLNFHASPTIIKQKLQQEALNLISGGEATFSADSIAKIMAAIDKLDKRADPIVVQAILKDLDNFISEIDPAFAIQCLPFHKQFLKHRISLEQ